MPEKSRSVAKKRSRSIRRNVKSSLNASYERFLKENDPAKKDAAGRNLIRSIFGDGAISPAILES